MLTCLGLGCALLLGCGGDDPPAAERAPSADERLLAAAYGNDVATAERLIAAGADVNAKDHSEQSAYLIATSEVGDDPRLLEATLAAGADVNAHDSYDGTGLIRAAERGNHRIIRRLLDTEIEVDHVNRLGWTALLEAIILGDGGREHTQVVRLLTGAGADVELADKDGTTPLEHARSRGFAQIARILRDAGAR
jgi:ankyrin repeat protein